MICEELRLAAVFRPATTKESRPQANDGSGMVYIAECNLGRGAFAKRAVRKGEIILAFGGALIDFAETKRRGPRECMAIQVGPDLYIDTQPPGVFANHSCAPNAGIRNDRDLVALRDIPKGEEIRYDYSTRMDEKSFTMACRCGAPECRQVVTDFTELPCGHPAVLPVPGAGDGFHRQEAVWRRSHFEMGNGWSAAGDARAMSGRLRAVVYQGAAGTSLLQLATWPTAYYHSRDV
jgi:hypothetical protein